MMLLFAPRRYRYAFILAATLRCFRRYAAADVAAIDISYAADMFTMITYFDYFRRDVFMPDTPPPDAASLYCRHD